ncbi:hypothetical protein PPACK8108_LOCUS5866 [Phakopsora pachyrhizi]|uniref:Uncharacterized protein n=1 Tax=Phakopsora pachyrhizi TaxID=170000 RepID=A0AAV0APP9_PHAPC|nr:hypothetical protein PPACK8108_LOCUS5866 [Phakopsora pachyrhizi]
MASGHNRFRRTYWEADEEVPEETRSEPIYTVDHGRRYFSRWTEKKRFEHPPEIQPRSRTYGRPPSGIPRYTGNFTYKDTTNSFRNQSTRPKIINNYLGGQNYQWSSHENNLRYYTRDDLEDLSAWKKGKGGIRDRRDYQEFMAHFDTILNDLIFNGYMEHEDEANIYPLNSLSTNLRRLVSWKLEKRIDKIRQRDGGFPTPPLYGVKSFIEKEFEFMEKLDTSHGKKNSEELMERRSNNMIGNFGIKSNKVVSANETRKETIKPAESFRITSKHIYQQYENPEEEGLACATLPCQQSLKPAAPGVNNCSKADEEKLALFVQPRILKEEEKSRINQEKQYEQLDDILDQSQTDKEELTQQHDLNEMLKLELTCFEEKEPSEIKVKECEKINLEEDINPFQNKMEYSSVIEIQEQAKIKPEEIFVKDCCVMSANFGLGEYINMEDSERSYAGGIVEA